MRKISVWTALQELINNISVGSKLLFATVCSLLIVGSIRFVIVDIFDIVTFVGKEYAVRYWLKGMGISKDIQSNGSIMNFRGCGHFINRKT